MEYKFLHQVMALLIIGCSLSSLAYSLEDSISSRDEVHKTELQWALCHETSTTFAKKTGSPLKDSAKRAVYYLDTLDMQLIAQKTFIRIREADRTFKSSAKVNFVDDLKLPWKDLKGKDSKCEWDRYGTYKKVGCSLNHESDSLSNAFSKDQKHYIQSATGFSGWADLKLLGPAQAEEWTWTPDHFVSDLTLEEVTAKGFESLELAIRVSSEDADDTQKYIQEWLDQSQVELCPVQRGKSEALIRALIPK